VGLLITVSTLADRVLQPRAYHEGYTWQVVALASVRLHIASHSSPDCRQLGQSL